MIAALKRWRDRQLGRGEASITVPMLDGALKPNRLIEEAEVLAELDAPEDLASDGKTIFVADGKRVLRHDPQAGGGWAAEEVADAPRPITALACLPGGGLALALDGREIVVVGGRHDGCRFDSAGGKPLIALNAITATNDGRLLATDGSQTQPTERWNYDLMELGRSGRVLEFDLSADTSREIASGLAYAYGVCAARDEIWISESWRHRLRRFGSEYSGHTVLDGLPGYPSRLAPAQGGDFWLTCFTLRTQLVEFVLREPAYRKRMIREIDSRYWISPALNSGNTYLEPMQGAQLKVMGIVKPWAPPRSYGLVIRLTPEGLARYSLHSRYDGKNHGVVAAVECGGDLYLLAKGQRRILRLSIAEAERSLQR